MHAIVASNVCLAHTPHDTIDALAVDDSQQSDAAIFTVRAGRHLMRSYDGGASWKELVNGIDARYSITSVALQSGKNDKSSKVFMATDGDGVYASENAGASWAKANTGLPSLRIQQLTVAPGGGKSALVFATTATGELFRRTTGEPAWQRISAEGIKVTAIAYHQQRESLRMVVGDDSGKLYLSNDRGENWKKVTAPGNAGAITSIAVTEDETDDPAIFVGTERRGVLRGSSNGTSFEPPDDWKFDKHAIAVVVSPEFSNDATVYASTWHEALLKSADGGKTWRKFEQGLSTHPQADLPAFYSPYFRQIAIDKTSNTIYLAGFDGLFKSSDNGRNWLQLETEPVGNIWALSLSPEFNNDFVVAVTTFDAGAYTAKNSDLDWSVNNQGLLSTRLRKLVFSPDFANDHTVFSAEDEGDNLLKSTDGGKRWAIVNLRPDWYVYWKRKILGGLHQRGMPASWTIDVLDQEEKIRANPKGLVVSPSFAVDRFLYIATRYRGNFESTDAVQTLDYAARSPVKLWSLAISPDFLEDGTLFASSREHGLYRSVDGGDEWRQINQGLDFLQVWQQQAKEDKARMSPELSRSKYYDILLAVSPNYKNDKSLFAAGGEGVFKSVDRGASWQQKGQQSLTGHFIFAIALSPNYESDQTLIVSVKGNGLFKSTDGGETFFGIGRRLIANNHEMRHIQFSPLYAADQTLYAVSLEDVFRSTDNGVSWQLIERPIRIESDKYDVINYQGEWQRVRQSEFSAQRASRSKSSDSTLSFSFVGTGVKWIGGRSPKLGRGVVYLDGKRLAEVDQHSQSTVNSSVNYEIADLPFKSHTLVIKAVANDAAGSENKGILIDALDITGNRR